MSAEPTAAPQNDKAPDTVIELLEALDARGDEVSKAAAHLIRMVGVEAPDLIDIENAEI